MQRVLTIDPTTMRRKESILLAYTSTNTNVPAATPNTHYDLDISGGNINFKLDSAGSTIGDLVEVTIKIGSASNQVTFQTTTGNILSAGTYASGALKDGNQGNTWAFRFNGTDWQVISMFAGI